MILTKSTMIKSDAEYKYIKNHFFSMKVFNVVEKDDLINVTIRKKR